MAINLQNDRGNATHDLSTTTIGLGLPTLPAELNIVT